MRKRLLLLSGRYTRRAGDGQGAREGLANARRRFLLLCR
jgi:hypothetical protein